MFSVLFVCHFESAAIYNRNCCNNKYPSTLKVVSTPLHKHQLKATQCPFVLGNRHGYEKLTHRDTGAVVGQGGRNLEKDTCTDYDVTMTSDFKPKGIGGFKSCGARGRNLLRGPCLKILC